MHDLLARSSETSRAWRRPWRCLALLVAAAPALAQAADPPTTAAQGLAGQLPAVGLSAATTTVLTLFLIAVLLESALALVFNWRPFIETFNARATRPLVAFLVAWIFVGAFPYDAVTGLMQAVTNVTIPPGPLGPLLTAAILAGGSAGVNNLLVTLGFRQVRTLATETPKVPPHLAWIALHVSRAGGPKGDVKVWIGEADANDPPPYVKLPLAGVISPVGDARSGGVRSFFLRDANRFPAFGGYEVPIDKRCRIVLTAMDAKGKTTITDPVEFVPGPGAIIDLNMTI
jgi:hypothetical protein